MSFENKRLFAMVLGIGLLLSVPLLAMRFTDGVEWNRFDFAVAGLLLLGTGVVCEFVLRRVKRWGYRIAICAAILCALLIVWAELAVGLFGTPLAGS